MKKKTKRRKRKKNSESVLCVCLYFFFMNVLFIYLFIYDKIAKIKEEFNILICSRSRIINLYVSCISNIR
jgi:hypothetical protein